MSTEKQEVGAVTWIDLTVSGAETVKNFYSEVTGWKVDKVSMGDYNDYNMLSPSSGKPIAGICNKLGANENLPSHWLIYITIENMNEKIARCKELGGQILVEPKDVGGYGKYCVIKDPAGAVCALFESN